MYHDWINEPSKDGVFKVPCKSKHKDLEQELITLTSHDLETLQDKFKAGYTLQAPEENLNVDKED